MWAVAVSVSGDREETGLHPGSCRSGQWGRWKGSVLETIAKEKRVLL